MVLILIMRLTTGVINPGATPARFQLGQVVVTPRALETLEAAEQTLDELLARHQSADWGNVSPAQRALNEQGISGDCNLTSTYVLSTGQRLTVFTRGDRTHTLVHLAPQA